MRKPFSCNSFYLLVLRKITISVITSSKGFSAFKCNVGNWIFSKSQNLFEKLFRNFLDFWGNFLVVFFFWGGGFFGRNFLGGFSWEDFFGRFFWRIFREEFFGRNYLVEINKELMFLSGFWGILSQGRRKEGGRKFQSLEV